MKKIFASLLVFVFAFFAVHSAFATEPPRPGEIERLKKTGEFQKRFEHAKALGNHRIDKDLLNRAIHKARAQALRQMGLSSNVIAEAPPSASKGLPTTGSPKIFAFAIDFQDYPAYSGNTQANLQSILFGDGKVNGVYQNPQPYEGLAAFYKRASYNQLDLSSGSVLGVYHAPYKRDQVVQTDAGRENLLKEALTYFHNQGVNFAQFDSAGTGTIPYFVVIWSGPDNGWANFWWGYKTTWNDSTFTLDGKHLGTYSFQWEYSHGGSYSGAFDPRVLIHETGHALGLPDYYDYDTTVGNSGGVGGLDIMDSVWGDHNAFSKWVLDWINPTVVGSGSQQVTLRSSGTNPDAVVVMPNAPTNSLGSEFFIVQNRYRTGNDPASHVYGLSDGYSAKPYPADGMLIWHVDATLNAAGTDFLNDNSITDHKLLKLMQADGLNRIEIDSADADAAMYYQPGNLLGPLTAPDSRNYLGVDTGVNVTNIQTSGQQMTATFSIDNPRVMPTLTIAKTGIGSGVVESVDGGIQCGSDCAESYVSGTVVTLTATPTPGTVFAGWIGGGCTGTGSCTIPVVANTTVTAQFDTTLVLNEDFDPVNSSLPAGWTKATKSGAANWWFTYTNYNDTGGTGGNALGASAGAGPYDSELRTYVMDLSSYGTVGLEFKTSIGSSSETADVDISLDGGTSWTNVWETIGLFQGPKTVDVDLTSVAAGQSKVMVRFHHYGTYVWWVLDDVKVMASLPVVSTTTSLASSLNPAPAGQPVTFTATVTPTGATGTVTFFDDTTSLGEATLTGGTAVLGTSSLSTGSHSITATYNGDGTHSGSTSAVLNQAVNQGYTLDYAAGPGGNLSGNTAQTVTSGGTGTAVTAVPSTGYHFVNWSDGSTANPRTDSNVTASLSVTANFAATSIGIGNVPAGAVYGGSFTPSVSYLGDGSTSVTSNTPAVCPISGGVVNFVAAGTCSLTAHATATLNYAAVDGPAQSFTVGQAAPTISISDIPSVAVYGGSFTATYAYTGDGTTSIISSTPANCSVSGNLVSFVGAGTCTLTAQATAGSNYAAVTGSAQSFVIGPAAVGVTLGNLSPTYNGGPQAVTVATLPGGVAYAITYTGSDNSLYGTGQAAAAPTNPGVYAIQVTITDPNYVGGATGTLTIHQLSPALSLAPQSGAPAQPPYGTTLYYELSIASSPVCPTGTVNFYVDGGSTPAYTATLNGAGCTAPNETVEFQTASLLTGTHSITAVYSGDSYYQGATSNAVSQTVYADSTAVTLAASGSTINVGDSVTFTATVTPAPVNGSFAQALTGAVNFNQVDGSGNVIATLNSAPIALSATTPYTAVFSTSSLPAGTYNVQAVFVDSDGQFQGGSSAVTVETVSKKVPVITWTPNVATITYGAALTADQLNATAADPVTHAVVNGSFNYDPAAGSVPGVPNVNVQATFTPADDSAYSTNSATTTITVQPARLTVTADNQTMFYGGTVPPLTFQYSGFLNGDGIAAVTAAPICTTTATSSSAVGTYGITCSGGAASNYIFNYANGTLTVTPATATISISNIPATAVSGGSFTPTFAYTGDGTTSVTSGTPSYCTVAGGVVSFIKAGACTLTAHATAGSNYAAADGAAQSFTVGQATTTIGISNVPSNAIYGGSFTPTFAYTGDGTTSVTSSSPSYCTVTGGVVSFIKAGTCTLTAHATAGADYAAVDGAAQSFTIGQATTTVSISNIPSSAIYGGSFTPTFAYTGDGTTSVTSSSPSYCTVTGGVVSFIKAGACTLTAHATAGTNYAAVNGAGQSFTIGQATTTIGINNIPVTAAAGGSFTPAFAYAGDGTPSVTSSTAACTVSGNVVNFVGAGICTLTAHATAGTNYAAVNGSAQSFTITATQIPTVTAITCPASVTYTGSALTPCTATVTASDGLKQTLTVTYSNNINAGTATASASYAGDAAHNASSNSTTFTINKSVATVTLSNLTQTYTGSALAPSVTTVPAGLSVTWTGAPQTNAGSYPVTATVTNPNYTGTASGTFVINKAKATVALSNLTRTYTGSALSPTVTTSPAGLSYSLSGAPDTNVGSYSVTATITNPNYTGTASGTFVINKTGTTIKLTSKPDPSNYGDQVTFLATVTANSGSAAPNGTVTFTLGSTVLANVTLTNGQATFTTTKLPIGCDYVNATYSGAANFLGGSTAVADKQVVNRDPTTTALAVTYKGSNRMYSLNVTVNSAYGTPAGTVTFFDGDDRIATVSLASGKASLSLQLWRGHHYLTAVYNGNSTFAPSWSKPVYTAVN